MRKKRDYTALDGTPAKKTPEQSPYCYDRFAIYRNGWEKGDSVMGSKKLIRSPHYRVFARRVFHNEGQYFSDRDPVLIQILVSMVLEKPVILTGIEEFCQGYGGYPQWLFYYREPTLEAAIRMKAGFYEILLERDKTYDEDIRMQEELERQLYPDNI